MNEQPAFGKILLLNLGVVVGSAVIAGLCSQLSVGVLLFVFALVYLGQVLLNVFIAFFRLGKGSSAYFLSALLVLLIGFGSCTGLFAYLNGNGGPPR